jgi:hypothetical protein
MLDRTLRNLVAFIALTAALSGAPAASTTSRHPSLSPPATKAASPARRRRLDDVCLEQAAPVPAPAPRAVAAPATPAPSCGAGA